MAAYRNEHTKPVCGYSSQRSIVVFLLLLVAIQTTNAQIESRLFQSSIDTTGPVPWSNLHFADNDADFHFAILADNTGYARKGILNQAIGKLNLLQPEFVITIGDMIEGNTDNAEVIEKQWDEYDSIVSRLQMPLFRIPGNHDYDNPVMNQIWARRYGPSFYSYIYKGVLFIVLNSQIPAYGKVQGQAGFVAETLKKYPNPRWTFVFIHQPVWNKDRHAGWSDIERLLADRPHTVFAGHTHTYAWQQINGHEHITLATTGGASLLGGTDAGQFDHLTWVTLRADSPIVANLMLDGIYNHKLRPTGYDSIAVDMNNALTVNYLPLYYSQSFEKGMLAITLTNTSDFLMQLRGGFDYCPGMRPEKNSIETSLASGQTFIFSTGLRAVDSLFSKKRIDFQVWYKFAGYSAEQNRHISIQPALTYTCPATSAKPLIDGQPDEWSTARFTACTDAKGHEAFQFASAFDSHTVYLCVKVNDTEIIDGQPQHINGNELFFDYTGNHWQQDALEIRFDARPDPVRAHGTGWDIHHGHVFLVLTPGHNALSPKRHYADGCQARPEWALAPSDNGYVVELAIPSAYIKNLQGTDWKAFRLNITLHNRHTDGTFSRLSWQPDWRSAENICGSGTFLRAGK